MLTVRCPHQVADVGVITLGGLDGGLGSCLIEIDLVLTGLVADVGDVLTVGAPSCSPLVGSRSLGDVPCDSLAHRNVEDLTTGGDSGSLAISRDAESPSGDLLQFRTGIDKVGGEGDVDLLSLLGGRIEFIEEATLLEHHQLTVGAGELDIEVIEVRHLRRNLCLGVVHEYIHVHVTVGSEIDLIADPHGEDVLGGIVGDFLNALAIVDPDLVSHASTIVLPCPELPHHAVVSQLLPIGRIAAEATFRKRKFLRHTAVDRHFPKLARETVTGPVAENDVLAVGSPCHDDIVGTHAVSKIITRIG